MRALTREFIKFFVSLKLTVSLLALSAVLVFLATIDQVHLGIWAVQEKWFKSFIVLHEIKGIALPVFPGGYFIGGLLLLNLIAAHANRFAITWKKAGIQLVHFGLILLLLGELFTGLFQEEYQMRLDEGQTKNYSESWRFNELAIVDTTSPTEDVVTVIPESRLSPGDELQVPALPFRIVTHTYFPNATLMTKEQAGNAPAAVPHDATAGLGPRLALFPLPITYKQDQRNLPATVVEFIGPEGTLGTYLLSTMLIEPERFTYAGREWAVSLRFQRAYKPYSLTLIDFTHDRYAGTEIPKNFASRVKLTTPDGTQDREVKIFMNNPLRYDGLTFFQAGFDNNDKTTVLQVVRNPSWLIPYLSCLLMAVGLYWQFGWHLILFRTRRAERDTGIPACAPIPSSASGTDIPVCAPLPSSSPSPLPAPPASASASATLPAPVVALGLILSLRVLAGLVGLWVTASSDGTPATIGLVVLAAEFLACGALLIGLATGKSWVPATVRAYAASSVLILGAVVAYGFLSGDIYDAILRWLVIGLHVLTAAGLLALQGAFHRPELRARFAA